VRGIGVRFRGAGCDRVFEETFSSCPLPHNGGAERCSGRETRRPKLGR
jgi:hypothetical protein